MRIVVQRVLSASLHVEDDAGMRERTEINAGLVLLVGIEQSDTDKELAWAADKLVNLRIFGDDDGRMNLSVFDISGEILLVPNFTVAGDAKKGRRPSFVGAMHPDQAKPMFERLAEAVGASGVPVQTGVFGAHMHVELVNDGPVTIWLDSEER